MLYESVFTAHIIGALATGIVGAYALVSLWNNFSDKYRLLAISLGALAAFEIFTGTTLSVLSIQISAASLCSRIFLYLSIVALIELLLYMRMKNVSLGFPILTAASPTAISLFAYLSAIVYGF